MTRLFYFKQNLLTSLKLFLKFKRNYMLEILGNLFIRDLDKLKTEITSYKKRG